jgi:hypothetical protein
MDFDVLFNKEKSQLLKSTRGLSFEELLELLKGDALLANIAHPNKARPNQRLFVINFNGYAYAIPYIIDVKNKEIFLKTIYPSRKFTKLYLKGEKS